VGFLVWALPDGRAFRYIFCFVPQQRIPLLSLTQASDQSEMIVFINHSRISQQQRSNHKDSVFIIGYNPTISSANGLQKSSFIFSTCAIFFGNRLGFALHAFANAPSLHKSQ
jgi:hypothetical protein